MKKALFVIIPLIILLAAGGIVKSLYDRVQADSVPDVTVRIFSEALLPASYDWHTPVFRGLVYKEFLFASDDHRRDFGEMDHVVPELVTPEAYDTTLQLFHNDELVFSGSPEEWTSESYAEEGDYTLLIRSEKPKTARNGYGVFEFSLTFNVRPSPELLTGKSELAQGEIFTMELLNLPDAVKPVATTKLGMSVFSLQEDGTWFAMVPVGNTRAPGKYPISVTAGEQTWEVVVTVLPFEFDTQNLIIDTSNPVISEASSAKAYQQYREKIPPLYETYDETIYWEGLFIQPAEGRISTQFGSIRYTNSNWSNPRYHWGMDIAADKGTPIKAPNNGRVVFAEYLLNTGNTIVIEHGGGLKSYYFHMHALHASKDDMVKKGDLIGEVGTTGYSTGPHLHFEMRIGNQAVSPSMLFEDAAGLYRLDL